MREIHESMPDLTTRIDELQSDKTAELILKIRELLAVKKLPADLTLGHYSTLSTIPIFFKVKPDNVVQSPSDQYKSYLRLTNYHQMNDPMEGKILENIIESGISSNKRRNLNGDYKQSVVYMSSATAALDSLPMWKQYSENATGALFVYDSRLLNEIVDSKGLIKIFRVCYIGTDEEGEIRIAVSGLDSEQSGFQLKTISYSIKQLVTLIREKNEDVSEKIRTISYLFKDMSYAYEKEYRLIYDKENAASLKAGLQVYAEKCESAPVPFLYTLAKDENGEDDLRLKYQEVILGPKCVDIDYIAPYIMQADSTVSVRQSEISYR